MKTPVPPPSKGRDRDWNEGLCGCREGEATKGNTRGALLTCWVASDCRGETSTLCRKHSESKGSESLKSGG